LGFLPPVLDGSTADAPTERDVKLMEQALTGWDRIAPRDQLLVGVTATPNRSDAVGLGCVFQTIAYSYGLKQAIADKWLVPIVPYAVETDTSLDDVRVQRGDFNQRELAETVNTESRNLLAVTAWREHAQHRPTLAFTVDVAHAHALAAAFREAGYRAAAVSGVTPKDERRGMLAAFQQGELDVLANCMVLTEGTDLPRASCILHAKPTKSATLYEQMTGRGLRLFPDKHECIVIDLVDLARRHSLQTAPVLYGLPPGLMVKGEPLGTVEDEYERLREEFERFNMDEALAGEHLTLADLRKRASLVDIWTVPDLGTFGQGRALQWLKTGDDLYRLTYPIDNEGRESLQVSQDLLGHWELVLTTHPAHGLPLQSTLATQVASAEAAAGVAEAFVMQNRQSVMRLKAVDAHWRKGGATDKQIALLRRLRIPFKDGITKGEASNLIDLSKARRG
jgi:ATP-dependent helicase IRC3